LEPVSTPTPFGTTGILNVSYGNGKFVAVGHNGIMAQSTDGTFKNWNAVASPFDKKNDTTHYNGEFIRAIAYGGGMFIAGGNRYEKPYYDNDNYTEPTTAKMAYGY
jgi:hypothetical protein